ncbi:hypothetical protein J7J13_02240, partial [bacterium]|nr:hypothetical protein [bacterium]
DFTALFAFFVNYFHLSFQNFFCNAVEEKMSGIQSQIARAFKLTVYFIAFAISRPRFRINFSVAAPKFSGITEKENVNNASDFYI